MYRLLGVHNCPRDCIRFSLLIAIFFFAVFLRLKEQYGQRQLPRKLGFERNEAASTFFFGEVHGRGVHYLVAMSQCANRSSAHFDAGSFRDDEIALHLLLTNIALDMSLSHQKLVLSLLNMVREEVEKRFHSVGATSLPSTINYPQSVADFRRVYTDGAFSIAQNMPIPLIHCNDNHSYILPSEMIRHILAHGFAVDVSSNDALDVGLFSTSRGRSAVARMQDNAMLKLVMWISGWTDDFDPNNTATHKGSVWAFTLTMSTPLQSKHAWTNSAVIALGPKKADHVSCLKALMDDINAISRSPTMMYVGGQTKTMAPVQVWLATMIQDTPARRAHIELAGARGLYAIVFGVSLIVSKVTDVLPSCSDCVHLRRNGMVRPSICTDCGDWDVLSTNLKFEAPSQYPKGIHSDCESNNGHHYLYPLSLKFSLLKQQSKKACLLGIAGVWRMSQVKSFLQRHTLSDSLIKRLCNFIEVQVEKVEGDLQYAELTNDELYQLLEHDETLIDQIPYPPGWDNPEDDLRYAHAVSIMHLLGLNHGKATIERLFECLKRRKKFKTFTRHDGVLDTIVG